MTMRPSLAKKEQGGLAHLGIEAGKAPASSVDPRIVAFETALAERRVKEKQMTEALKGMQEGDGRKEALTRELAERKEKERQLQEELEALRKQLESKSEEVDPYVAQLEAEISTLKFANLAQMETFAEQKQLLEVAQEKALLLDETLERSARMEAFLNEVQEERNSLAEQLDVAQQQLAAMTKLAGQAKPADGAQLEQHAAPFKKEIADLRSQLKARDDEIARQQEVVSQMRVAAERSASSRPATASAAPSSPPPLAKSVAASGSSSASGVELDSAFEGIVGGNTEVFAKLVTAQMERNKERVSLLDKKAFKDPTASTVTVLCLVRVVDKRVVACAGLIRGAGTFDLKYVAFESEDDSDRLLGQIVLHASKYCVANGADQLIALFSGARNEAEKKWGPHGFKFVGVGPAPDFMVRLAMQIKLK